MHRARCTAGPSKVHSLWLPGPDGLRAFQAGFAGFLECNRWKFTGQSDPAALRKFPVRVTAGLSAPQIWTGAPPSQPRLSSSRPFCTGQMGLWRHPPWPPEIPMVPSLTSTCQQQRYPTAPFRPSELLIDRLRSLRSSFVARRSTPYSLHSNATHYRISHVPSLLKQNRPHSETYGTPAAPPCCRPCEVENCLESCRVCASTPNAEDRPLRARTRPGRTHLPRAPADHRERLPHLPRARTCPAFGGPASGLLRFILAATAGPGPKGASASRGGVRRAQSAVLAPGCPLALLLGHVLNRDLGRNDCL